ncbi:DNA polymerase processivity factor [Pelagibacter phage HTVC008M]|uniref:DNA polymerase processivity factor n=1 Tax=Pelagibacter phage HTVC008M TaxID=1283076 RepID=UPI0002B26E1B|nr:DNA polymerase processivity factor [Pelagibacter phage HTVC008M]AGE60448.1 sliding clamp DNA polymerase accessory protein [Pelagibacter phage HTVC008M]
MQLSESTKEILKNFSEINPNLMIKPGKELKTISTMKNILATANVSEEFPQDIAIYDLNEFLGVMSLFTKPQFTFDDKSLSIGEEGTSTKSKYYFADPSILTVPQKDVKMPEAEVQFTLTETDLTKVKKAASMLQLPDIAITSKGSDITLSAIDKKNDTANNFSIKVGETNSKFEFHFKTEHLKMLPGDYNVSISSKLISNFKHKSKPIQYWIALENTSKFTG